MTLTTTSAVLLLLVLTHPSAVAEDTVTSDDEINCGACKGLFDEIDYLVSKVPDYASIDTGSQREWGKNSVKRSFARSEVHLYEVLDVACHQMENYSGFEEQGIKVYKRYQNRPEQKTPLKLANFGWHVDTQARLRFACDSIMNLNEEELVDAYIASEEVPFKVKLCTKYCTRANMMFQLNAWYGKDINGKPLPEDETEYVNGVLKASALVTKNKKEHNLHKRKVALDDKKKKRDEKKKASEPKEDIETLELGDASLGQDGKKYTVADDEIPTPKKMMKKKSKGKKGKKAAKKDEL